MAQEQGLWEALRERRVIRTLAIYLAGAWLVLQVAEIMADIWELSSWVTQGVFVLLVLGLPITAVLAWLYDLTGGGVTETRGLGFAATLGRSSGTARWTFGLTSILGMLMLTFGVLHVWPDEHLDHRLRHLRDSQFLDTDLQGNLAYALYGFNAPMGQDPDTYGRFVVDTYKVLGRMPDNPAPLEFTVEPDDRCSLTHGCSLQTLFAGLDSTPMLLSANAELMARYRAMRETPAFSEVIRPTTDSPVPEMHDLITAQYLAHRRIVHLAETDRVQEAWTELAEETHFHRAVLASGNHLLIKMVAVRLVEEDVRLRLALLARGRTRGAGRPPARLTVPERSAVTAIGFELQSGLNYLFDAADRRELADPLADDVRVRVLPLRRNATANYTVPVFEVMEASLMDTRELVEWSSSWDPEADIGMLDYMNNGAGLALSAGGTNRIYLRYIYRLHELDRNILLARIGERMIAEHVPPDAAEGWLQSLPPEYRDPFTGERASWADGVLSYPDPELGWEVRRGLDVALEREIR